MKHKPLPIIFALVLQFIPGGAAGQIDLNNDGVSDFLYVTAGATLLGWKGVDQSTGTDSEVLSTEFGAAQSSPIPARWSSSESTDLAVIEGNIERGTILWQLLDSADRTSIEEKSFGRLGDTVVGGGDYDGDGIADPAIVRISGNGFMWIVKPALLSSGPRKAVKRTLGRQGDRCFFISADGLVDQLAVFGPDGKKSRLQTTGLLSKRKHTYKRFPLSLSQGTRPRPFPIKGGDGTDLLGFVIPEATKTGLFVYTLKGKKVFIKFVTGQRSASVGDYLIDEPGEEVALQGSTETLIFNPVTQVSGRKGPYGGTILDDVNVYNTIGTTPAPTTPTPTATPTPT